ncbi:MAG: ATP-grasp domain-containing protein [Actinobacteria bacterium]|nr:ATP-grasp domain-containing protein [Actinomycetota bacterium]
MRSFPSSSSPILVHEFVTGGGWPDWDLPESLAGEGLAMLKALLADFRAWGRFPVLTTLDRRLRGVSLPADRVVALDAEVYHTSLVELAGSCEAALIVAPETRGTLEHLSALMLEAGVCLLGSRPEAVAVAADKWECHRLFELAGLATPETVRTTPAEAAGAAAQLGFPLVVKPIEGAGCEGVGLVRRPDMLERALDLPALRQAESLLLQRYIDGAHASVSLLVTGGDSVPLSLNEQWVQAGIPFVFRGGVAAISHDLRAQALDLARRAAALVPGLQGYVGVDLMLTEKRCSLIEINPRPTTSYVGVRRVVDINLAEAIWRACRDGVLPEAVAAAGEASFTKEGLSGHRGA